MPVNTIEGNLITLLKNGAEFFPALEAEIHRAQLEIRIETYIFALDEVGERIAEALLRAAQRGVRTRLVVDGIGSKEFANKRIEALRAGGVQALVYRPDISPFKLTKSRLRRLHRKVAVFDGRVAFVGGINIVSDFAPPNTEHPQFDYAVRIEGPLIPEIYRSMERIWKVAAYANFKRAFLSETFYFPAPQPAGEHMAAFVFRDNLRHRRSIEDVYFEALATAKRELLLANAYFLPGRRFRTALREAAARGVHITLLLQGYTDHRFLRFATHALYIGFLGAGIRIAEYERSMLHAKVCVVDGEWATVGSSNLDPFSLLLAREANVVVHDQAFARQLKGSLEAAIRDEATMLEHESWERRGRLARFASWSAYGFARLVMGLVRIGRGYT